MNKVQAGRLLTLAWFLRTRVPRRRLDMTCYAKKGRSIYGIGSIGTLDPDEKKVDCGTSGCALGWSTAVFPRKFQLLEEANGRSFNIVVDAKTNRSAEYDDAVVREWFGLDLDEACDAFGPIWRTPQVEASILERLAKKHGYVYAGRATTAKKTKKK